MVFETLKVRKEGAVLFADIAAAPMNLLGPELVRDLVSLIQQAEADPTIRVLVFKSADPDYFISHVDVTRLKEIPGCCGESDWRRVAHARLSSAERKPSRHHCADRGTGSRRWQRVRAGVRHALCRERDARFSVSSSPLSM